MTRTLVVTCADWPVRAADGPDGGLDPDRPTAIWSHRGIVATNPAARAAGVRVGLRRREAQGRCPEMLLIPHDPARDARCFEPVVAALGALTPWVEIVEPGTAALATRGPSRYFGGDEALARRVSDLVRDVCTVDGADPPTVRVGVADGPLVARLAARRATPTTPTVVAPGDAPAFVAPLPVAALAPFATDPDILDTWRQLGLDTLGDVAALPAATVLGRFGDEGIRLHRLAGGDDPTVSSPTPVPAEVGEQVAFDPPETRAEAVAFVVRTAADTFVARLGRLGLSCAQVVVTLTTDHAESHERRWRLDGPGRAAEGTRPLSTLIAERVRWQVDGWLSGSAATRPTAGIIRVALDPGEVRPARGAQHGFWGGASALDDRAARAVARLEALCGPDAVCVVEPRGGRHPATEFARVPTAAVDLSAVDRRTDGAASPPVASPSTGPAAGPAATGDPRAVPPWPGRLPAPSPTTVPTTPLPVEVLDASGRVVEVSGRGLLTHAPATICFTPGAPTPGSSVDGTRDGAAPGRGRRDTEPIVTWAGPWPVDERWWDPEGRLRQARLQLTTGRGTALLVTRQDRRWWISAVYG